MGYKRLTFTANLLLINDSYIQKKDFNEMIETSTFQYIDEKNDKVDALELEYKKDRFLFITINSGQAKPRCPYVINSKTGAISDNKRGEYEVEPKQIFVIIDMKTSFMWISNSRKIKFTTSFIGEMMGKEVCIKDIYNEKEFIEALESLDQIKFSAAPNLFSDDLNITRVLAEDVYGYDADIATLVLDYKRNKSVSSFLKEKILKLLKSKNYADVVISGRDKDNIGLLFNANVFSKKIIFESVVDENEMFDLDHLFKKFEEEINNEKN